MNIAAIVAPKVAIKIENGKENFRSNFPCSSYCQKETSANKTDENIRKYLVKMALNSSICSFCI